MEPIFSVGLKNKTHLHTHKRKGGRVGEEKNIADAATVRCY